MDTVIDLGLRVKFAAVEISIFGFEGFPLLGISLCFVSIPTAMLIGLMLRMCIGFADSFLINLLLVQIARRRFYNFTGKK